jgi:hypothetical protein
MRRDANAGTGTLSGLDPAYLAAKERLAAGKSPGGPIPKRQYGRTRRKLSIIGFGVMVVRDVTPRQASGGVSWNDGAASATLRLPGSVRGLLGVLPRRKRFFIVDNICPSRELCQWNSKDRKRNATW